GGVIACLHAAASITGGLPELFKPGYRVANVKMLPGKSAGFPGISLGASIQQRIYNARNGSRIQAGGVRLHYFIIE
ncbi:MAG: hypothetical protein NTX06_06240, partial [Proteobacteria bacterium]|nr:hypothetical protein [Pseudomonadota bacterium]